MNQQEERKGDGEGEQIQDPGQEPDTPVPPGDDPSGIAGGDDPKDAALKPDTWAKRDRGDDGAMGNAGRGTEPAEIEEGS
jgi:hypothetical protein